MESAIGLYKTELMKKRGPWRSLADVELATAEYVEWFNSARLHSAIGHIPPAEYEAAYHAQHQPQPEAAANNFGPRFEPATSCTQKRMRQRWVSGIAMR
jgi:putative transposase